MKKIFPVAMAALLTVSFTAFSAFRPAEKKAGLHYKVAGNWYTYSGNQCPEGDIEPCQVSNPIPGQTGTVILYTQENDTPEFMAYRTRP